MDLKKISEFEVGNRIEGFFVIRSASARVTSNGKKFMDIDLADTTGEVNAKLWDSTEEQEQSFLPNTLIKVRGDVIEYRGNMQLKINKIRLVNKDDNININDYVPCAPKSSEFMFNELNNFIKKIKNDDLRNIVEYIINEDKEKLEFYPAAKKNHHAIRSGLLYHIMRMLYTAERLCEVYDSLNSDLLFAGVILHDMSKIEEMDSSELGIVSDYTVEGTLLGHIIQGVKRIDKVSEKIGVDKEISLILQHMILSHHGIPEYGSPKIPMVPEAQMLHYIDNIDAKVYDMEKALSDVEPKEFTDRIWSLDNRKLYKTAFDKK